MTKQQLPKLRPLDMLEQTIAQRATEPNEKSYTCKLLAGGVDAIGVKIIEEAAEVVEAAAEPGVDGKSHFIHEVADVVYHLMVLLRHQGVALVEVEAELACRFGISGLEEKEARGASGEVREKH